MNAWTKEQLEEMFGDNVIQQLAFVAGCTKHSYSDPKNPELDGFIISQATLDKFAELILQEHVELLKQRWYTLNNTKPPSDESPRDIGMRVGQKIEVQQCIQLLLNHWKDS